MTAAATQSSRARQLKRTLEWTPANLRIIARAYLDDPSEGDYPQAFFYQIASTLEPGLAEPLLDDLDKMRREHFAALGKPLPTHNGPPIR
jgi:hypothetical protein